MMASNEARPTPPSSSDSNSTPRIAAESNPAPDRQTPASDQQTPALDRQTKVDSALEGTQASPRQRAFEFRHLLWAGLFMLVGISFLILLGREKSNIAGLQIGDLDIQPLLNTETGLSTQDMRGKLVLLHFWGPWCPPCLDEYPEIVKLQHKYDGHADVLVVSISCDSKIPENAADLSFDTKRALQAVAADLKIYSDPAQYSRVQIANLMGRKGFAYPTSILVDRQMKVIQAWVGATREGELEKEIQRAVATSKSGTTRER